ncbi:MAG: cation-binding protein [Candidatus Omnitrophica bacterium]|nr:cation-binding protein [Candidatus Omnitrophota bacterium]
MLPAGPLMKEHRLIEQMIGLVADRHDRIGQEEKVDPVFIDAAVDFIRTYADRCHHGKEEDILFRELEKKDISDEHKKTMEGLVSDHKFGRKVTGELEEANEAYKHGKKAALKDIQQALQKLTDLYPQHIEIEDKHFFLPVMDYFSDEEKSSMLSEMMDFDREMIHKKYRQIVDKFKG